MMDYEENNRYVHDYEDDGQPIPSTKIGYDNTDSGLNSVTVQGAIDEVAQILDEKQDKTYDGTESGIEADTVTGAIDELAQDISDLVDIVEDIGNYQFIGKTSIPITITGNALNFVQTYPTTLKEYLDTLDETTYLMPFAMNLQTKQGTTTVTNFGGNNVKQEQAHKMMHSGMAISELNIDAESTVLFSGNTKVRWRKIVCNPTAGHLMMVEIDSTTDPVSISFISHDEDECDNVTSTLYCLQFKKVK